MQKTLIVGVMLLGMFSCSCVSLKDVTMYTVSLKYNEAGVATKNLDIKEDPDKVGEWNSDPVFTSLNNIPQDLQCFSLQTWLDSIKPSLKKSSRAYRDRND